MNAAINRAMKNPDVAARLDAQGIDVMGGTPQAGQAFLERQMDIWAKVVRENNIKPD
jgi:tripartite-type tricarboxylate transporter receptor subunit TctC